ncbi:hypothetical protein D3C71_2185790 [compost metagenome]
MICGMAKGNSTLRSTWAGVAPKACAASTSDGGVEMMPRRVRRMGAGMAKITVAIRPGTMPRPKRMSAGIR